MAFILDYWQKAIFIPNRRLPKYTEMLMRASRETTPPAIPPMGTLLLLEPPEMVGGTRTAIPVMVAVDVMPPGKIDLRVCQQERQQT
jgi:hypothetical protein